MCKGVNIYFRTNSDLCHLQPKLIGFLNQMKFVYSAVRTGALNKAVCAQCVKGLIFISEKTANCATYSLNWLVFINQMKSVYSAVRTCSLNKAVCAEGVKGLIFISEQRTTCATYTINWLVLLTQMKSVYSAVRTGSLYVLCGTQNKQQLVPLTA